MASSHHMMVRELTILIRVIVYLLNPEGQRIFLKSQDYSARMAHGHASNENTWYLIFMHCQLCFLVPDVCNPESICRPTIVCPCKNDRERRSCMIADADGMADQ